MYQFLPGSSFSSFKTHANRKHPNWQQKVSVQSIQISEEPVSPGQTQEDDPDHHDISDSPGEAMDVDDTTVIACDHTDENIDPKRTAALFLLTFKEKFNLSQKAMDYAVGSITTLVNQVSTSLQQSVQHVLKDRNLPEDISQNFRVDDLFAHLHTEHRQFMYYKREFGLVVRCLCMCSVWN